MPNPAVPDDLDLELNEPVVKRTTPTITPAAVVPSKYEGKSIDQLIAMNEDAQREISRKGNEIGDVRRMADALIGLQKRDNTTTVVAAKPVTVDSLLENPEVAIRQTFETSPLADSVRRNEDRLNRLEHGTAEGAFKSQYKDFQQDIADPAFAQWITKNPTRTALAQQADKNDYQAASSLWSMWDEYKTLTGIKPAGEREQERDQKLQQSSTVRGSAQETRGKPVYSRSKLMELRYKVADGDPVATSKWSSTQFQSDLADAYREGRVK